jgi:hypothetical protein
MSLLIAAAAAAAMANQIPVEAGRANWGDYPAASLAPRQLPTMAMVTQVETMLRDRTCRMRGQRADEFDIDVPYLALVQPDGSLARVVVADMGCPELETLVGEVVLSRAQAGDFRPTGAAEAQWYASNINFNLSSAR